MRYCFAVGLIRQGLLHDLSKFGRTEFSVGVRYYQGNRSPNNAEREDRGLTTAWLHHKGRNKHHFEYWIDYIIKEDGSVDFGGCRMPKRYVAEMWCDRVAASRVYLGDKYTDAAAYDYYHRARKWTMIHPETGAELEKMLLILKEEGEEAAISYIRKWLRTK